MNWVDQGEHALFVDDSQRVCGEVKMRIKEGTTLYHAIVSGKFVGKYLNQEAAKNSVEVNQHLNLDLGV